CDLQGDAVDATTLAAPTEDAGADLARLAAEIERLCARHGAVTVRDLPAVAPEALTEADATPPRRVVLGIGITAPAPLDVTAGVLTAPPWLPGWHGVPVVAELEAATGLPALL